MERAIPVSSQHCWRQTLPLPGLLFQQSSKIHDTSFQTTVVALSGMLKGEEAQLKCSLNYANLTQEEIFEAMEVYSAKDKTLTKNSRQEQNSGIFGSFTEDRNSREGRQSSCQPDEFSPRVEALISVPLSGIPLSFEPVENSRSGRQSSCQPDEFLPRSEALFREPTGGSDLSLEFAAAGTGSVAATSVPDRTCGPLRDVHPLPLPRRILGKRRQPRVAQGRTVDIASQTNKRAATERDGVRCFAPQV